MFEFFTVLLKFMTFGMLALFLLSVCYLSHQIKKIFTDVNINFNHEDFQQLVAGGILKIKDKTTGRNIYIILSDIGFNNMHDAIEKVEDGKIKPYPETLERVN